MFHELARALWGPRSGLEVAFPEALLFRRLCLLTGALLLFVVVPLDVGIRLSQRLLTTVVASGAGMFWLAARAWRGRIHTKTFLLLITLIINVGWLTEGGVDGSVGYFFGAAAVYIVIFFHGARRWTYLALVTVDGLTLLLIDYLHPEWTAGFADQTERFLSVTSGFIVNMIALTMMIWVLREGYDGERRRQVELNQRLSEALTSNRKHALALAASLAEVKTLRGLLPICSNCKSVRDDAGLWTQIEAYVSDHTDASFTHSLCPDCLRALYPDIAQRVLDQMHETTRAAAPEPPAR